jgi:hypothetical protein
VADVAFPRRGIVHGRAASRGGWMRGLALGLAVACFASAAAVSESVARRVPDRPMAERVRSEVLPQFEFFFRQLVAQRERTTIDGVRVFDGRDKFLSGKIAIGLSYLVLDTQTGDVRRDELLRGYREIADLTVDMDNETWGIYYYLLALHRLDRAGLLGQAVSPDTLAKLKRKLDWRSFVTADYRLIALPANYYGVAFSVARLRMLLGWEDETGSAALLEKMLSHYKRYSGEFGFSDETDGEGRFDRYSILLVAEVCERFIETGLAVTPDLRRLLRKSVDVAFNVARASGEGFAFGRSIGPYGDTAALEILTVAGYLGVLDADEKEYAYAYSTRVLGRYLEFWYNPALRSVDMWEQGRRTDAYRGKHRILGENLSLLHQLVSAAELWKRAGFANRVPAGDLDAWLGRTQPAFRLHWFAQGEYDRALAIVRDGNRVFTLLMVNGGPGQHDNSPYYPLPFANDVVAGVPDSGARDAQLLPKLTLRDGTQLLPTAFIRDIRTVDEDGRHVVTFRQDALDRLGRTVPVKDERVRVETRYTFAPGEITRTDRYIAAAPVEVDRLSLVFASFSEAPRADGTAADFGDGVVRRFSAVGFDACRARALATEEAFRSPTGPMKSLVECSRERFVLKQPLVVEWTLRYR